MARGARGSRNNSIIHKSKIRLFHVSRNAAVHPHPQCRALPLLSGERAGTGSASATAAAATKEGSPSSLTCPLSPNPLPPPSLSHSTLCLSLPPSTATLEPPSAEGERTTGRVPHSAKLTEAAAAAAAAETPTAPRPSSSSSSSSASSAFTPTITTATATL